MLSNLPESNRFKRFGNYQNGMTLLIFLLCIGIYFWLAFQGNHNLLTPAGLKATIQELGAWSALVYMGILALSVIISPIPGAPLVVAGGVILGFPLAGLYSVIGGLIGGLVAYFIGGTLGDSTLQMLTGKSIQINQDYKNHYAGWLVFFSRLFPVLPFGFISYSAGIAQLPARSYAVGTLLGMTPPTLLLSYLGESLTTSILRTALMVVVVLVLFVGVPLAFRQSNFPPPDFPETREAYLERLRNSPIHLCRLRYFGNEEAWTFAFYTYSNEKYEPCLFDNGTFYGTPEEALAASAIYLQP